MKQIKITALELLETRYDSAYWTWFNLWLLLGLMNFVSWVLFDFDIFFCRFDVMMSIGVWFFTLFIGLGLIYLVYSYKKYVLLSDD